MVPRDRARASSPFEGMSALAEGDGVFPAVSKAVVETEQTRPAVMSACTTSPQMCGGDDRILDSSFAHFFVAQGFPEGKFLVCH